jgi:hypothetical protein
MSAAERRRPSRIREMEQAAELSTHQQGRHSPSGWSAEFSAGVRDDLAYLIGADPSPRLQHALGPVLAPARPCAGCGETACGGGCEQTETVVHA